MPDPTLTAAPEVPDATRTSAPDSPSAAPRETVAGGGPSVASPSPATVGFELQEEIGRGGMGVVYRARDLALNREVAVKVLQDKYAPGSGTAVRFVDEARITGQLQHPGIPAVYQVGTLPDGRPFLAMKLIRGDTLDARMKANVVANRLAVFEAICQAVGYAHAHGVLHRDLKPHNVMVGSFGEVQVMDWGLAKVLTAAESLPADPIPTSTGGSSVRSSRDSAGTFTQYGSVMGTPAYMAPEQAGGETDKIDRRSDVFGLGAILCVLLTGKPPFGGKDAESIRLNAVRGRIDEAVTRLGGCGAEPEVVALCKACLAFDRNDRPADANAVATRIAEVRAAAEERARQAEVAQAQAAVRAAERRKQRRLIEWAAAALFAVLIAGAAVSLWQAKRATAEAANARAAEAEAGRQLVAANDAYALSRESLVQVGTDMPEVLRQAIYTRDARTRANQVLADALAKQLDPTAVRGLPGRTQVNLLVQRGDLARELGKPAEATASYRTALELSETLLAAGGPEAELAKGNQAVVLIRLAVDERDGKRTADAVTAALAGLAEAEKLHRERLANPPPDRTAVELRQNVAETLREISVCHQMLQQYDKAVPACRDAVALLRPRPDDPPANRYTRDRKTKLVTALSQLGKIQIARQDDRAAEDALTEAVTVSAEVLKDDPKNPVARLAAARAARDLGDFLLMRNRLADAAPLYAQDLTTFRELLNTPELQSLKFQLGDSYYRAATLAAKRADKNAAAELYSRCKALWAEVTEVSPTNGNRLALGLVQARLGDHATAAVFARKLLADGKHTPGDGIQAVSVLALCGGAADGDLRRKYFADSLAGLTVLVEKMGYKNISRLKTDPDLDPLRGESGFQKLVEKIDAAAKGK